MKAFPIALVIIVSMLLFFTQCETEPDPNDPVDIPDNVFLNALIEEGVDTNGDGRISYAEAEAVTSLNLDPDPPVDSSGMSLGEIQSINGLEAFINLDTLHCCYNKITELDVSNNTELEVLVCWSSQLTSLNVSQNKQLKVISVPGNKITNLNISNNEALEILWCGGNQLSSLDISNNTNLNNLWCAENQLTSLDISQNIALTFFGCSENQLTSLDISQNIYIGNSGWDPALILRNMPTLTEVCVWTMPFPPEGVPIDTAGSPNVYFTTDCSK